MVCSEVKGDCVSVWLNVYSGCMWATVELSFKNIFKFSSGWGGGGGKGQTGKWGRVEGASASLMKEEEEVFASLDTFFFI